MWRSMLDKLSRLTYNMDEKAAGNVAAAHGTGLELNASGRALLFMIQWCHLKLFIDPAQMSTTGPLETPLGVHGFRYDVIASCKKHGNPQGLIQ